MRRWEYNSVGLLPASFVQVKNILYGKPCNVHSPADGFDYACLGSHMRGGFRSCQFGVLRYIIRSRYASSNHDKVLRS